MDHVVSKDVAEAEFERMLNAFDVVFDGLDEEDQESFDMHKARVLRAICEGRMTVDEIGLPTVILKYPVDQISAVPFKHPVGETLSAVGDTKNTNDVIKAQILLSDLTGRPQKLFQRMRAKPDLELCNSLVALFLG